MAKDKNGNILTKGCKVFDTYSGEFGIVISIPDNEDCNNVMVRYLEGEAYAPPIELEKVR